MAPMSSPRPTLDRLQPHKWLLEVRDAVGRMLTRRAAPAPPLTIPSSLTQLDRRQAIVAIPTTYSNMNDSPSPGTVIGIVLGSVAGFLMLLGLLYMCFNMSGSGAAVAEEEVVVSARRGSRSSHSRSRRAEMIESSRSTRSRSPPRRSPVRTESRTERIIVEERRAPVSMVDHDDDIVEVIEENSPPRRSRDRPRSGYRPVEPDQFAGGNYPVEEVYAKRSSRRSRRMQ